ncbi:hypothetical protein EYF80_040140 [Liparis tanakae]|uniref:Uncharacterized protein n=1 Tax=Liparis tanakae TaxID=230148 RepID=A0A4Z2G9J5_9TELE|nr:hypothetical protein EYF80_040140 [Liparis tanakae]
MTPHRSDITAGLGPDWLHLVEKYRNAPNQEFLLVGLTWLFAPGDLTGGYGEEERGRVITGTDNSVASLWQVCGKCRSVPVLSDKCRTEPVGEDGGRVANKSLSSVAEWSSPLMGSNARRVKTIVSAGLEQKPQPPTR